MSTDSLGTFDALVPFRHDPGVAELRATLYLIEGGIDVELDGDGFHLRFPEEVPDWISPGDLDGVRDRLRDIIAEQVMPFGGDHMKALSPRAYPPHLRNEPFRDAEAYGRILMAAGGQDRDDRFEPVEDFVRMTAAANEALKGCLLPLMRRMTELHLARNVPVDGPLGEMVKGWVAEASKPNASVDGGRMAWLLGADRVGTADGAALARIVEYRMQASSVYGAVGDVLREPEITAVIDEAGSLNAVLSERLGATRSMRAAIRRIGMDRGMGTGIRDDGVERVSSAVRQLCLYEEPLSVWDDTLERATPGNPRAPSGNQPTVLHSTYDWNLVSPLYARTSTEVRDVVNFLERDILRPIIDAQMGDLGRKVRLSDLVLSVSSSGEEGAECREAAFGVVRAFNRAVVGDSTPTGFAKAAMEVHRFTASMAALRQEVQGDTPPWPALFRPWTSEDGRFEVITLTSAAELVEEGLAMEHCVGGYADQCRTGRTHICSVRVDGERAATLEVFLDVDGSGARVRTGQFKGHLNRSAPAEAALAVHAFRDAMRSKEIKPAVKAVREYMAAAEKEEGYRTGRGLSMEDVERLWAVYRDFLVPGAAGMSVADWAGASGITEAVMRYREAVERAFPPKAATEIEASAEDAPQPAIAHGP